MMILAASSLAADNGRALLPPMGWRSWNLYGKDIDDARIRSQIDALVQPRLNAFSGRMDSLFSLGYDTVGIDEGWEGCGLGENGSLVHYANGTPAIAPTFPDMGGLVRYGRSRGVKMGWYFNGCGCTEVVEKRVNYEGDVAAAVAFGFDSVKADSCGAQKNVTLYSQCVDAYGSTEAHTPLRAAHSRALGRASAQTAGDGES